MPQRHMHNFRTVSHPLRVYSGEDALTELPGELARTGARRAFVLCGRSVDDRMDLVERLRAPAGERFAGVFAGQSAGAPRREIEAAAAGADVLVAIGAGSVTKAARVVAIRLAKPGPLEELAAPGVRALGDLCPGMVADISQLLGASGTSVAAVADALAERLREFGYPADLAGTAYRARKPPQ